MKLQLPRFDKARLLVVGDVMLDRYWHGDTSRISPEAPVPVVRVRKHREFPGGAGNVALNLAALGAEARLHGVVGDDEAADRLLGMLNVAGVNCDDVQRRADSETLLKIRLISRAQQLARADFEPPAHLQGVSVESVEKALDGTDVLLISDYGKGAVADAPRLIAAAKTRDIPVLVDPKGRDFGRYAGATLLTPNLGEFEEVVGPCADDEAQLVDKGMALIKSLRLDAMLITRGADGMTLLRPGVEEMHLPARSREVFDVTGAGDTVIAALGAALAAGTPLPEAAALANLSAGIAVGRQGAAVVSAADLQGALKQDHASERGVLNRRRLAQMVAAARSAGERIVLTNGCFDILHIGHITLLEQAAALGDRLVVALNSDASVRKLKGEGRPINALERRMALLAALEAVDWVTSFYEDTPEALLEELKPDILVKGGDYKSIDEIVGADIVRQAGGEVRILDFVADHSTSDIVRKIKRGD